MRNNDELELVRIEERWLCPTCKKVVRYEPLNLTPKEYYTQEELDSGVKCHTSVSECISCTYDKLKKADDTKIGKINIEVPDMDEQLDF